MLSLPSPVSSLNLQVRLLLIASAGGTVTLRSNDPFKAPLIDPQFLNHPFDIHTMIQAVKAAKKFVTAKAWKDYVIAPYGDFAQANTDAEIESYARAHSGR
jgi:hypothetical protein